MEPIYSIRIGLIIFGSTVVSAILGRGIPYGSGAHLLPCESGLKTP